MKHFRCRMFAMRSWLRSWLLGDLPARMEALEKEPREHFVPEGVYAEFEKHVSGRLDEMEQRLEQRSKRAPSGRPFSVLREIAESGAQKHAG